MNKLIKNNNKEKNKEDGVTLQKKNKINNKINIDVIIILLIMKLVN